jgi:hypothetical protein
MVDVSDDGEIADILERRCHKGADSRRESARKDALERVNSALGATG